MGTNIDLDFNLYTVAWIAPLEIEAQAAWYMLDNVHRGDFRTDRGDDYVYTAGDINGHNVIIATFPAGHDYGVGSAAALASQVKKSFPNLWFGLLVGVAAGLPNLSRKPPRDIRLGDVLVGVGEGDSAGLVSYGLGKETLDGFQLLRHGSQAKTETVLRSAIGNIKAFAPMHGNTFLLHYEGIKDKLHTYGTFTDPGQEKDQLYQTIIEDNNREVKLIERVPRSAVERTKVWYGPIGSGDRLMKDDHKRDELRDRFNLIGLEMEAAGTMNTIGVGVIRGVCDYGDAQKNKEWQPYAAAMAAAYAKGLLYKIKPRIPIAKEEVVAQAALNAHKSLQAWRGSYNRHWVVPRGVNTFYTGRLKLREILKANLCVTPRASREVKQKRFVITGIGGAGKSELCLKFAEENRESFWGIFWIDASSETTAIRDFKRIAAECGAKEESLEGAKCWLENTEHEWLLIIDNADDAWVDYSAYFPSGNRGTLLITSRNASCRVHNTVGYESFDKLDQEESVALLLKAAEISNDGWANRQVIATEVAELLGFHALAIIQAGAFIRNGICELEEYPSVFRCQRQRLLTFRAKQAMSVYGDVYGTFEVSASQLESSSEQQAVDALGLLKILAFLHFDAVPELMLRRAWVHAQAICNEGMGDDERQSAIGSLSSWHVAHLPALIRGTKQKELDTVSLREARDLLESFSLVSFNKTNQTISMHPLVHFWAKDRLLRSDQEAEWISTGSLLALSIKESLSTDLLFIYDPFWKRLHHHLNFWFDIQSVEKFQQDFSIHLSQILFHFGCSISHLMDYLRAESIVTNLFKTIGYGIKPMTPNAIKISVLKADVCNGLEQYQIAEEILEEVVKIQIRTLSPDHPDLLVSQHSLAEAYMGNDQYGKAEEKLEKIVKIQKATLNPEHPHRLTAEHALARAYLGNRQYQKAEEMLEEVVRMRKRMLGREHPHLLASQHVLAEVYMNKEQYQKAEEIIKEVVNIQQTTLNPGHERRLAAEHILAQVHIANRQYQKAEEIIKEVVKIRKTTLTLEHPNQLASGQVLALAYIENGKHQEAEEILKEIVKIQQRTLNPEHEYVLDAQHLLAYAHIENGQYQKAREILEEVVKIQKSTLSPEHPSRLASEHHLARALRLGL